MVFYDEMTIRARERRGQLWITRTKEEAYHPDCIESRFSAFTELTFWGCYTMYRQGPCIFFDKETQEVKEAAKADLITRNGPYLDQLLQAQARLADENARRPKSRQLKRIQKPHAPQYKRGDRARGGIDWYRYQEQVIKPHLAPFIMKIIRTYGHCYLVQDGAPAHNAWPQSEHLNIPGLTILPWPGNSPDLNQIEPCWYHLKRQVTKVPFRQSDKEWTRGTYEQCWKELDAEKRKKWCGEMVTHMERCIAQKGDNKFHG